MTHNLNSHQAWLKYYESKAVEVPYQIRKDPSYFRLTMLKISQVALDSRAKQLRDSDSYTNKKLKTAAAGFIPFLKIPVSIKASEEFADEALLAFGLRDAPGLQDLTRQLKASTSGRDNMAIDILTTLASLSKEEILAHASTHAASEAMHVKPIIGQMASAGTGYVMVRKRLIGIIDKAKQYAAKVHTDLLIPVVLQNMRIMPSLPAASPPSVSFGDTKNVLATPPVSPAIRPPPVSFSDRKRALNIPIVVPPSKIAVKKPFTLKRLFFEICMSPLALLTWGFLFSYVGEDTSHAYWVLLALGLIIICLLRLVRAFRVMSVSHMVGIVLFQVYRNYRQGKVADGDQFFAACLVTIAGLGFLRV